MTVTYTAEVATCRGFGCFLKLLMRWRGSIYKLVWLDLIAFLSLYYGLNIVYRYLLDDDLKIAFEGLVHYCALYSNLIPLSFILGFYVSIVMTRWWNQYNAMPWPDALAVFVSSHIHGQDERGRVMRRTIMRYVCLCLTKVLTMISPRVKKRFPTYDHLVEAGLLVDNEKFIMEDLDMKFPNHSKHWLPIVWAASIVTRARKEGRIRDDFAVKTLIDELNKFRGQAGTLLNYDMVSLPLVYTQVVTLAVYSYFLTCAVGRQWIAGDKKENVSNVDSYFPFFTMLEFFFYMGWLKVAESLINPWGDDDDDFEVNWLVDRNLQVSYLIVDEMHHDHPQLVKDQYWDDVFPSELPYTVAAEPFRDSHPLPSTANIAVPKVDERILPRNQSSCVRIGDYGYGSYDDGQGIQFTARPRNLDRQNSTKSRPGSVGSQSNISVGTYTGSMSRVNSVSGVLKRLFSKDDSKSGTATTPVDNTPAGRLSGSSNSLNVKDVKAMAGSTRLAPETIEEVDEQLTLQSIRHEPRSSVFDVFPSDNKSPTKPLSIPKPGHQSAFSSRFQTSSVPLPGAGDVGVLPDPMQFMDVNYDLDNLSFISSGTSPARDDNLEEVDDEFSRLKAEREKERRERHLQKLAVNASTLKDAMEGESLLAPSTLSSSRKSSNV